MVSFCYLKNATIKNCCGYFLGKIGKIDYFLFHHLVTLTVCCIENMFSNI